jgi:hypothetical protein
MWARLDSVLKIHFFRILVPIPFTSLFQFNSPVHLGFGTGLVSANGPLLPLSSPSPRVLGMATLVLSAAAS